MSEAQAVPTVHFLLKADVAEMSFNPVLPGGLSFSDATANVEIKITPAHPGADQFRPLVCSAYTSVAVPTAAHSFVAALIRKKFEIYDGAPIKLPFVGRGKTLIDDEGNVADGFGVPFEFYPLEVQAICDAALEQLSNSAERFLRLLRWQQNLDGPHWVFDGGPALYWKVTGKDYWFVSVRTQEVTASSPVGIEWNADDRADLEEVWADRSAEETMAHELLREAKSIQSHSPRSAFLITTSALEVGVKAYVAHLSPDTAWLLSELPAPPIHKILRTYIPELQKAQGRALAYWDALKPLFNRIREHAETRNKLTHTGRVKIASDVLEAYIQDVSDLLYLFDALMGHEDNVQNLSHFRN